MNTVQTVVMYAGSFQNAGTYCIHYRYCRSTFQLHVCIVNLCILIVCSYLHFNDFDVCNVTFQYITIHHIYKITLQNKYLHSKHLTILHHVGCVQK